MREVKRGSGVRVGLAWILDVGEARVGCWSVGWYGVVRAYLLKEKKEEEDKSALRVQESGVDVCIVVVFLGGKGANGRGGEEGMVGSMEEEKKEQMRECSHGTL